MKHIEILVAQNLIELQKSINKTLINTKIYSDALNQWKIVNNIIDIKICEINNNYCAYIFFDLSDD